MSAAESQSDRTGWPDQMMLGDNRNVLKGVPDGIVDFIVTSPPYADSRKSTYGGVHPDKYVSWFLPIDQKAKEKDQTFKDAYNEKLIEMTVEFTNDVVTANKIDWLKFIDFVSKRAS